MPLPPPDAGDDGDSRTSRQSLRGLDWFTFFLGDIQTGFGPFIAVYLSTQKWNQTDIGLVLSVGALASLFSQVPGGWLVDSVRSERSAAAAAVAAIGISAFMIAVWPVFVAVASSRALQAAATSVLSPAIAAISLGLVGRYALAARLGRNARFASAGNGAAAVIMGATGHFISAQAVFFVTAGFTLPALAALFRIKDSEVNAASAHGGVTDEKTSGIVPGVALLLRSRAMWVFIAGMVMFQLANAPMLPLVATELTKTSATWAVPLIGACIVLPQIIVALFAPWVGRLAQRIGRRPLLVAALAVLPIRGAAPGLLQRRVPGRLHPNPRWRFGRGARRSDPARRRGHFIRHRTFQSRARRDRNVDRARRGDQHDRRGLHRRHVRAPCRVSDAGSNGGVRRFAASVIHARDPAHG